MKTYSIDWKYEDHYGTPLPPKPDGWDFAYVEYDGGVVKIALTDGKSHVHFWLESTVDGDVTTSDLDVSVLADDPEGDLEAAIDAYGTALIERFDASIYDAAYAALEAVRADLIEAVLATAEEEEPCQPS